MKKIIPLTMLIIVLIIASTVLFIQNESLKKEIGILKNKIADLEKEILIEKKGEKDWKIYENKKYNYIINYPEIADIDNIDLNQCGNQCVDAKEFFYKSTFNFFVYNKPANNNLADYINNIFKNSVATLDSKKWIDIAGQKGYQINASVDYSIIYTYVINGNYLYEIDVINPNEESLIIYDKILESFKFIN